MASATVHNRFHFDLPSPEAIAGDGWAGFAAMLVALPSAVAYGVAVYSIFGPQFVAQGAIAGVIGAAVLGLIAPAIGGAPRLVSAPCAPAAAMMAALATQLSLKTPGAVLEPPQILLLLTMVALLAGLLQLVYGLAGGGQLIKYIPFPVISGYLSAVGVIIIQGQIPQLLGLAKGMNLWIGIASPHLWQWPNLVIGGATIVAVIVAPKLTRALPAPIFGMAAGMATFFVLTLSLPEYFQNSRERLVVGAVTGGFSIVRSIAVNRWSAMGNLNLSDFAPLVVQSLTLSILLSIDTLKTCVVVDTLTHSRHNSNRELMGQGVANSISAMLGGIPGGGTTGATLVNVNSGARTKWSGFIEGFFVLSAFLFFGRAIGQMPIAALAGILIVVAARMVDRNSLDLLRHKSTVLDFLVIVAVIGVAIRFDLIAAAGVGLALSILLFIREQIRGTVIRRKLHGDQVSSKQHRLPAEKDVLRANGTLITVCQLQGSLFFGTTDQLLQELDSDLKQSRYIIFDMTRVQSVDFTAAHMLEQIETTLRDRSGQLIFASLPASLPTGQDLQKYFRQLHLGAKTPLAMPFNSLDEALEWTEDRVLEDLHFKNNDDDQPLELAETDLLKGLEPDTISILQNCSIIRTYEAGERIFRTGDSGDELFLIRKGAVRISLQLTDGRHYNVTTFARGDFFGDMAFLDRGNRSADATAIIPTELFEISRRHFDEIARDRPVMATRVFEVLAGALAVRLRYADVELRAIQDA